MRRPCLEPGCPETTERTRCPRHEAQRQRGRARPTTSRRGYGSAHQSGRAALAATLPAPCGYCGATIRPGERWDAAHRVDGRPELGLVVAHPRCNQREGKRGVYPAFS